MVRAIPAHALSPNHRFAGTGEREAAPGPKLRRRLRGAEHARAAISTEGMGSAPYLREMACARKSMLGGKYSLSAKRCFPAAAASAGAPPSRRDGRSGQRPD